MKTLRYSFLLALAMLLSFAASAQCAMCRVAVENNLQHERDGIGANINSGILYLLSVPYLMFMVIGFIWYKNSKKNKNAPKLS